jgi:hypothetical protein
MPLTANTTDPKKPDYLRPEVTDAAKDLTLIHDLLGGPQAMWDKSGTYIRKWSDEDGAVYDIRRLCEPCADLFGRTLSASVGKLFAKPPKLEYPTQAGTLSALWDNIDAAGTKGDVAVKEFASDAIADGFALILVDHTTAPAGAVVTAANESALGLRPVWAFYERGAVHSWREAVLNNVTVLTQVVLAESAEDEAGAFGVTTVHYFRELHVTDGVAGWRLWRAPKDENEAWVIEREGTFKNRQGKTRSTLPIAVAYAGRKEATFVAAPPLRSVAYANLAHWRMATELCFGSQVSAIESPLVKGAILKADGSPGGALRIGWLAGNQVEAEGDFSFVGPSGAGLDQLEKRVIAKEQEIGAMGLSFMSRDTRAAETAEAKRLDAAAEDSTLATVAQATEDAVNLAWEHTGWYVGLEKASCPTVTINRDFTGTIMSPEQAQAIAALVGAGMPIRVAVATLITGGFLKATEDEVDEIVLEWEAGKADAEARAEEAREDAAQRSGFQRAA